MTKTMIYRAEEIFQDIEGDDKNVLMTIPPAVAEKMGWQPGDVLSIKVEEGQIVLTKKDKETNGKG